jgi:hypothetical protein
MPRLAVTVRKVGRKRIEEMLLEKTACYEDGDQPEEHPANES